MSGSPLTMTKSGSRVFTPAAAGPHPAFVHFHGGGFVFGTIDSLVNDAKCAHICSAAECVVATVEYRLAPEHRFPTAAEDCYAALLLDGARMPSGSGSTRRVSPSAASPPEATSPPSSRSWRATTVVPRSHSSSSRSPSQTSAPARQNHPSVSACTARATASIAQTWTSTRTSISPIRPTVRARTPHHCSPTTSRESRPAHVITAEYDVLRDSGEAYARRLARGRRSEPTLHRDARPHTTARACSGRRGHRRENGWTRSSERPAPRVRTSPKRAVS